MINSTELTLDSNILVWHSPSTFFAYWEGRAFFLSFRFRLRITGEAGKPTDLLHSKITCFSRVNTKKGFIRPRYSQSNDWTICQSCFKRTNGIDTTKPKKKTWRLMMLLLQGLMRRFDCLRAAFSLRFYLYSFRNFFSYMPPLPLFTGDLIKSMLWTESFFSTSVLGANMSDWERGQ